MSDAYEGLWHLVPELSHYETGDPPKSGTYRITNKVDAVFFEINWIDAAGNASAIQFGGPLDADVPIEDQPGLTHARYTRVDGQRLQSSSFNGETLVAFADRRVSDDGQLMSVLQRISLPDGSTNAIFQVYRRED